MRRPAALLLILCLLLTGCVIQAPPVPAGPSQALPSSREQTEESAPLQPESTDTPASGEVPGEEALPELEAHSMAYPQVHGPAGSVYAISFNGARCSDPVYGDVDGDGQTELVYRSAGLYDGSVCEAILVYGLEDGWPIQKGNAVLRIANARTELVQKGRKVCYSWQNSAFGQTKPLLLEVRLDGWRVSLNGGKMPEGLQSIDGGSMYSRSFRELRQLIGGRALAAEQEYIIWREPGTLNPAESMDGVRMTCAAATNNGVTVNGAVFWRTEPDGRHSCIPDSASAPSVRDPDTLLGKTEKQLTDKLGFPAFERRSGEDDAVELCWFTEQGKLLTVRLKETVVSATLTDLPVEDVP